MSQGFDLVRAKRYRVSTASPIVVCRSTFRYCYSCRRTILPQTGTRRLLRQAHTWLGRGSRRRCDDLPLLLRPASRAGRLLVLGPDPQNSLSVSGCCCSASPSAVVVWAVPCSRRVRRQAAGASKAEHRDGDEAVKEAIDDHAEPTGCCLGPATWKPADMEAFPQPLESLPHVLAESPRVQMKVTHSLIIDSSATAFSLTLTFLSLTVFVVGPVSLGPRRQAAGASTAERRDADEAVKEAIDDHAEPTGCCLAPATRRRGSLPPAPRIPAPCPASPRVQMKVTHSLIIDSSATLSHSLSLFSLSQSLWLVP